MRFCVYPLIYIIENYPICIGTFFLKAQKYETLYGPKYRQIELKLHQSHATAMSLAAKNARTFFINEAQLG